MVFVDMLPFVYPQLTVVFIFTHSLSHHLHHYPSHYLISYTTYCQWFSSLRCLSLSIWTTHWCWSWSRNEPWDALCTERTTRNHHIFHGQSFSYPGAGRTIHYIHYINYINYLYRKSHQKSPHFPWPIILISWGR